MKPFIYSYTGMSHFYYLCVCHVYVHVGSACIRGYVYIMNAYLCTSTWGLELLLCMFFSVIFHLIFFFFLRKGLLLNLECLDLARLSDHWALLPHSSALRLQMILYWTTLVTITGHIGYEQQVAGVSRHFHFSFHMIYTRHDFVCFCKLQDPQMRENLSYLSFWNWCGLLNMTVSICTHFLNSKPDFLMAEKFLSMHTPQFIYPVCWWTCRLVP